MRITHLFDIKHISSRQLRKYLNLNFKFQFLDPVWPIPTDFIPLHIFDEIVDPIPDIKLPDSV